MAAALHRGFTLIELLVALTIAGLLLMLALPGYTMWLADGEIRNGAQSVAGGLRYAQNTAISHNLSAQFIISATGWTVEMVGPPTVTVQTGTFNEGARRAVFTSLDSGGLAATTVAFNALGQVIPNATNVAQIDVTMPSVSGTHPLRVMVGVTPSGVPTGTAFHGVKLCDPDPKWVFPDPRACPP